MQEIGLDYFKPKTSASTVRRPISSKEVKELWSQARMRLGVSSLQDWGLAALQRAVESIQALPTDGSAVIQLTEQLASVQEKIAFMGKIWADGMSLVSWSASFLHCRLRDDSLAGISSLGEEQKRRLRVLPMVGDCLTGSSPTVRSERSLLRESETSHWEICVRCYGE